MPTREQHIQKIREACIAANPSILDLTFGCELYYPSEGNTTPDGKYWVTEVKDGCVYCIARESYSKDYTPRRFAIEGNFEILGRPIHLADVLLAVEKQGDILIKLNYDKTICIKRSESVKGLTEWQITDSANWDLSKNSLIDQSDETIEFISKLLEK